MASRISIPITFLPHLKHGNRTTVLLDIGEGSKCILTYVTRASRRSYVEEALPMPAQAAQEYWDGLLRSGAKLVPGTFKP